MQEQELFDSIEEKEASLSEGGGTANGGDGGSSLTESLERDTTPSVCPSDSQLPQGGSQATPEQEQKPDWYIDLTREEFVRFRMLLARVNGPLRMRLPSLLISLICCAVTLLLAVEEWAYAGWKGYPDPVLLAGAVLVLLPGLYTCLYVPFKMKKTAGRQYDRSISAGMDYCGRLIVCPEFVEKKGHTATGHIRLNAQTLFIECPEMMVFTAAGSPAVVIPARCLTEEMAAQIRQVADQLPLPNRRFLGRVVPGGQMVTPTEGVQPEEWWVSTFTYTVEEYTAVLRGLIARSFWQRAPLFVTVAACGAVLFTGWNTANLWNNLIGFVAIVGVMLLFNLALPLWRVKQQAQNLSPHELTMQVRLDSLALRVKGLTTGENWVLWCDVDHVYDRDDFVEFVHNKYATLHIPKRVIPDLDALDTVVRRCRGMEKPQ